MDYKDGGLSIIDFSEFHHIIGQPLFIKTDGYYIQCVETMHASSPFG
ncbi:hypothetical protein HMPREF3034_02338 [Prevotella sp. DNF00663]|nr:hypothetical protein HMPREF3034_02338 [Prevotella sp. DNF00663]